LFLEFVQTDLLAGKPSQIQLLSCIPVEDIHQCQGAVGGSAVFFVVFLCMSSNGTLLCNGMVWISRMSCCKPLNN
jgi:hypothetical protein